MGDMQTPPTDYSGVPTPEEEAEGLAAAEASLPTKENDESVLEVFFLVFPSALTLGT